MSGIFWCIGPCFTCGQIMSFNPDLVPSIPAAYSGTGEREAVCRDCCERAAPERARRGLPPIRIHPDAYA